MAMRVLIGRLLQPQLNSLAYSVQSVGAMCMLCAQEKEETGLSAYTGIIVAYNFFDSRILLTPFNTFGAKLQMTFVVCFFFFFFFFSFLQTIVWKDVYM